MVSVVGVSVSIWWATVVGKIKSRFDLNRDLRHTVIRFRPKKIRFDCLRLEIWFDLLFLEIWFGPKWFGPRIAEPLQNGQICHTVYFLNSQYQVAHYCLRWSFAMARTACISCNLSYKTIQQLSGHHHWQTVLPYPAPSGQNISKCPSNIGLSWRLVRCC